MATVVGVGPPACAASSFRVACKVKWLVAGKKFIVVLAPPKVCVAQPRHYMPGAPLDYRGDARHATGLHTHGTAVWRIALRTDTAAAGRPGPRRESAKPNGAAQSVPASRASATPCAEQRDTHGGVRCEGIAPRRRIDRSRLACLRGCGWPERGREQSSSGLTGLIALEPVRCPRPIGFTCHEGAGP